MELKREVETTPLQQAKKDKVDEITGATPLETRGVKPGSKRGPYKGRKRKEPKPPEPEYTPEQAENEASFLCELLNTLRENFEIPRMNQLHEKFLQASSKAMFLKYGPSASKWMPEIMFGGSLLMVAWDTAQHFKIKKAEMKIKKAETKIKKEETDSKKKDAKNPAYQQASLEV